MAGKPLTYMAHSPSRTARQDPLYCHLSSVAQLAEDYASAFNAGPEARLAGLAHDLGKYGDLFRRRLVGLVRGVDHWSPGAWAVLLRYKELGVAATLAVQGHHVGLLQSGKILKNLDIEKLRAAHPLGLQLSPESLDKLMERFHQDGLKWPAVSEVGHTIYTGVKGPHASAMLDVRMLFSALVDADFIETEAHFQADATGKKQYRQSGPPLAAAKCFEVLQGHISELAKKSEASDIVNNLRQDLLTACMNAADLPPGLFTLTAPTGTGKTLSMLSFALKHAMIHNMRRIITVIPYLTIIEQTARVYREALSDILKTGSSEQYILEHHSLAGIRGGAAEGVEEQTDMEDESRRRVKLLAENWDAPIIITTSVQFLESLFANRPAACRKLHRLAGSVILFDEVQTLPAALAVPTLATLSRLAERYGATVVFSTATQPAFDHLNPAVKQFCSKGWQPREIAPAKLQLFERSTRTQVNWPNKDMSISWPDLAARMLDCGFEQVLCIVNIKRHAWGLLNLLEEKEATGLFHLSTNMCPAHREVVIKKVRRKLKCGEPCLLVSTQCVEAGVDLDFPIVFRALGPLDAVAQAAGRCNRNGLLDTGWVHVFKPEEETYPDATYRQATSVTSILLKKAGEPGLEITSPDVFNEYYRELYNIARPENQKQTLTEAITIQHFEEVAHEYRLIARDAINVLVPYDEKIYERLADEVRKTGLTRRWIEQARPLSISLFKPKWDAQVRNFLEPAPVGRGRSAEDWFIYLKKDHYDRCLRGLVVPEAQEVNIA